MTGETVQTEYAESRTDPGAQVAARMSSQGDEAAEAQAKAAEITRFVPASENWAERRGR